MGKWVERKSRIAGDGVRLATTSRTRKDLIMVGAKNLGCGPSCILPLYGLRKGVSGSMRRLMAELKRVRACLFLSVSAYCREAVTRKSFVMIASRVGWTGLEGSAGIARGRFWGGRTSYSAQGSAGVVLGSKALGANV